MGVEDGLETAAVRAPGDAREALRRGGATRRHSTITARTSTRTTMARTTTTG